MMAKTGGMNWKWIGLTMLFVASIAIAWFVLSPRAAPSASNRSGTFTPQPVQTSN
jgi:uncharacterized protein YpmS